MYLVLALLSSNNYIIIMYCLNLLTSRCPNRGSSSTRRLAACTSESYIAFTRCMLRAKLEYVPDAAYLKTFIIIFFGLLFFCFEFALTLSDNLQQEKVSPFFFFFFSTENVFAGREGIGIGINSAPLSLMPLYERKSNKNS